MASPTAYDTTTICTEAYKLVGIESPSAAQITRATNYFLEQTKNDIWSRASKSGEAHFKSLQTHQVQISKIGISGYTMTSDFWDEISVSLLTGTTPRDVNSDGSTAATVVALSSCEDHAVDNVEGKYLLIVASSTGAETELHQVTDYATSTETDAFRATLDSSFGTQPAGSDDYVIVNREIIMDEETLLSDVRWKAFSKGMPSQYVMTREAGVRKLLFNRPFENSYTGILIRYYADINRLDTSGNIMNEIYQSWKDSLILGVASRVALNEDDNKYEILKGQYEQAVNNLLVKELPYSGEFEGFEL